MVKCFKTTSDISSKNKWKRILKDIQIIINKQLQSINKKNEQVKV
jgi:hypothetical protein